ncbi:MAG: ubiquinol oxidase subunit II [Bacteroidia bacterium]|nr:MAG: ubiquinol oxidase subunit II [Bacteroidia bacterium]
MMRIISVALCALFLTSCKIAILEPKGAVAIEERNLIYIAIILMLLVVVPAIIMTFVFAWKYRESNHGAKYSPNWSHSNKVEIVMWGIPCIIILALAILTWKTTHELDPYRPLDVAGKPVVIEVVALDWKWLFIYPEQNIATVNFIQFPVDVPITFKVTSDAPMNSFMIPQLGGQIYAMAGMQTKLHLIADTMGDYPGRSVSFTGRGFSGMTFVARVSSRADFLKWVAQVKKSGNNLSAGDYLKLAKPSENNPVVTFASVEPKLYENIIMKYMMPGMDDLKMHATTK